jgi:hypothetical protein
MSREPYPVGRAAGTILMNYYRFCRTGDKPGTLVFMLFEVDDDGMPVRQIDIARGMFLSPHWYTRDRPQLAGRGRLDGGPHMRSEPFELSDIEDNRTTPEEFELAWSTGQYRVRDYHEFKWDTLLQAKEGSCALQQVLFVADAWYPNRALSERLALCERAVRELLFEGLVLMSAGEGDARREDMIPIPPERYDEFLLDRKTWFYLYLAQPGTTEYQLTGPLAYLDITEKGREVFDRTTYLDPRHWRID